MIQMQVIKLPLKHSIDFCLKLFKGTKCCVEAVLSPCHYHRDAHDAHDDHLKDDHDVDNVIRAMYECMIWSGELRILQQKQLIGQDTFYNNRLILIGMNFIHLPQYKNSPCQILNFLFDEMIRCLLPTSDREWATLHSGPSVQCSSSYRDIWGVGQRDHILCNTLCYIVLQRHLRGGSTWLLQLVDEIKVMAESIWSIW